ncbi:unnamed protein product [Lepeophtheirus salmonis]|uniref:(salmon louse) hypothetical protein n=1 Tax=Lepeophtheirus salmonis TaxID=72036 RepID=A0A7R8D185_LEPSM|nr:unnamed protein product [Lepeophtheirus salmonis]CAF2967086.1 unnamed protein product [Lepeophtheirus salmonis]
MESSSEHLDSFHTERTCSECGGNFMTKKAFDTHQHKKIPIGETTTNTKSDHDSPEKPSHNNGGGNDAVCSLPPKKRSSPLKNWSPKRDGKDEKESRKQTPPLTSTFQQQDPGEEEEIEEPYETSLEKRSKTRKRNRARKNYTDIDLYLDESEEEAILQKKILKQTSRLRRGKKSKNEHSVNNISVTKSDNESINESTNDSLHNRDSLSSTRGKRRGRCKKV